MMLLCAVFYMLYGIIQFFHVFVGFLLDPKLLSRQLNFPAVIVHLSFSFFSSVSFLYVFLAICLSGARERLLIFLVSWTFSLSVMLLCVSGNILCSIIASDANIATLASISTIFFIIHVPFDILLVSNYECHCM